MDLKISVFVGLIVIVLLILPFSTSASGWSQYGSDPSNTSRVEGRAPYIEDRERLVWNYRGEDDFASTPALVDDKLIIGNDAGEVLVLNTSAHAAEEERLIDRYEMNASIETAIAHSGESVIVSNSQELFSFDVSENYKLERKWYYTPREGRIQTSPVVEDEKIIITETHYDDDKDRFVGNLLVLDEHEGMVDDEPYWEMEIESTLSNTPALKENRLYLAGGVYNTTSELYDGFVKSIDLHSGDVIWREEFDSTFDASPTVEDDLLFLGSSEYKVLALDKETGEKRWAYEGEDEGVVVETFAVQEDRLLYSTEEKLVCLEFDSTEAELDWSYDDFIDDVVAAPAVIENTVFLGTEGRRLYAFEVIPTEEDKGHEDPVGVDYDLLWIYGDDPADEIYGEITSQVVLEDGRVYFGAEDEHVYALGNSPPSVSIDVSDRSPRPGEIVELTGTVDDIAEIEEYRWSCEELGILSQNQNFTRSFDEGVYQIEFEVRDEFGEWSRPASVLITVEEEEEDDLPWLLITGVTISAALVVIIGVYFYKKKDGEEETFDDSDGYKSWDDM